MQYKTFIDEAGNTGWNIWDNLHQDYFVIAAITLHDSIIEDISDFITDVYESNKINTEKEFKTATWVKNPKKHTALASMLKAVNDNAACIHVAVMEKKIMSVALIINGLFDAEYNDVKNFSWVNDKSKKIEAADYYYNLLSDEDIKNAGEVLLKPNEASLHELLELLLNKTDRVDYLEMLNGIKQNLDKIIDEDHTLFSDNPGLKHSVVRSPNFTSFHALGNMIARDAMYNESSTELIFDDASMCNAEFRHLYDMFSSVDHNTLLEDSIGVYSWKDRITNFITAKSDKTPCLQIADLYATSISHVLKQINDNVKLTEYDQLIVCMMYILLKKDKLLMTMSSTKRNQFIDTFNKIMEQNK